MNPDRHARTMLPIPDRPSPGLTTYDAKDPDTAYPPIEPLLPPEGAPNVLVVLLDDVGFGASSAFGGPCETPNAEKLAAGGLKYNRFHTTALCAPTRAAMLSGRNHHSVGMGSITETATSAPGNSSLKPNTKAPLAMTLKLNGYSTAQFGKCHEVPVWQSSPMGPFDAWPSGGGGFETFYGFIGGENNQWDPALYDGTTPVEPPATPEEGYHLTEDLADHAVSWIRTQKALMPEKPFFVYFAPGATHAPHHVPKEWADKYRGRFADGWDVQREKTFARQKELGVIPTDAELTPRHAEIPAWDDMPDKLKPVLEREMEVYAGFLEHTDHHVGRVIEAIPVFRGSYPADLLEWFGERYAIDSIDEGDLARVQQPTDFLGVNYYARRIVRGPMGGDPAEFGWVNNTEHRLDIPRSDIDWEMTPDTFLDLLVRLKADYGSPPILITENGAAIDDTVGADGQVHDPRRIDYLRTHLAATEEAIARGVDVRGYFA